jgi:D-psicose/D-tagatose/L-ribulose 3-epimerase
MRFGVHLALWMKTWHDDLAPYIEEAARIGFDSVELSLLGLSAGEVERLRRTLDETGVEVTCTTGLSAEQDVTSDDPAVRRAGIGYLEEAIRIAARVGSPLLSGVIYAPWGQRRAHGRRERWNRAVEALRAVALLAEDHGVTLALEPINRYETDLVTTSDQAARMVGEIDHPNVGILLDTYHMNIEEKRLGEALTSAGAHLAHLHVVENDRGVPGSGHIAWPEVAASLRELGYRGRATLEMFVQPDLDVSSDLSVWRPIEVEPSAAARAGLAFLRERLS